MIDFKLMPHQKEAIEKSKNMPDIYLAFEMGTGKTCTTIQMIRARFTENKAIKNTIIVTPLITLKNWKEEFEKFSTIHPDAIHVLKGSTKKRAAQLKAIKEPAIVITNYESFDSQEFFHAVKDWKPAILVADEAQALKNSQSKRAKKIALIADECDNRYLLSGTPILNSPMDLFMPFRILDGYLGKQATFGKSFFAFRANYFEDANAHWSGKTNHFPNWQPRPSTYEQLNQLMYRKMFKVTKEECLELPDLVVEKRYATMSPEQNKIYKELKRDFITYVKDLEDDGVRKAVVARLAIVKALRLHQLVTGFVKTDSGEIIKVTKNPRLDLLKELLLELTPGHKVIVWAVYKENYRQIRELCEELNIGYTEITGEVKTADKFNNMEHFKTDDKVRVCIANPASAGIGINLCISDYSIYYSSSYKLGDSLQSEARNHRKGSEIHDRITRINIITVGSIDELIYEALENKQKLADLLLEQKDRI